MALVASDTGSVLQVTCKNDSDDAAIDLTGATVKVLYKINNGALVTKTMTITDAANGIAQYQFTTAELTAGQIEYEIEITDGGGNVTTSCVTFFQDVRARLPA